MHTTLEKIGGAAVVCTVLLRASAASAEDPPRDADDDDEVLTATATVEAPARAPVTRTVQREEMASVAGTRGDALRAVELLPGVSRPPVGSDQPVIRGANPFDTQVFLEGAPVPILFHLAGLSSFVHSRVLESIDLQPSNFSPRYGRKVGGIIEVRLRDPRMDGLHGVAEVSFLDTSIMAETPIGKNAGVLAAVRRSNLDAVLRSAQSLGDLGITAAPVYWDYQSVASFALGEDDRLRLLAYGSRDSFGLVLADPNEADPAVRGAFGATSEFHRVQVEHRHRWKGGSSLESSLTYGRQNESGSFGDVGRYVFAIDTLQARTEATAIVAPELRIVAGVDALANRFDGSYAGIPPPGGEGDAPTPLSLQRRISLQTETWVPLPGAYVEAGIRPTPALLLAPGIRADYNHQIGAAAVDPRFSMRYEATSSTALKAGVGRFSQSPDERMAVVPVGNPNLRMTHALHASSGVEHRIGDAFVGSVEGFGKWITGVVAATPEGRPPFYANAQDGRVFGAELMLRKKPREGDRFFGFLSYTLMRSERRDAGTNAPWRLFDRDQPHIVSATAVVRLGRGWEVGSSLRFTSGTPYTPIVGATYEATTDVYSPRIGRPLSARNPPFFRLDARVQKTWDFRRWKLAAYLDVQNATNQANAEGFSYSYDYRRREANNGIPILPILGVRGEL
ncbi:MAG: TonB-dependent receptor [Labilithrix sp.]|nr:TonB-dependent receptor [Labilithrix sp.]MCW5810101.1 TonB-dependent receptor [Labilithrix sp.]